MLLGGAHDAVQAEGRGESVGLLMSLNTFIETPGGFDQSISRKSLSKSALNGEKSDFVKLASSILGGRIRWPLASSRSSLGS